MNQSDTSKIVINGKNVRLRRKSIVDARDDYRWQTDPELAELDATTPPDLSFSQYLSEYTFELSFPSSVRREFAVETLDGTHIGNCVYYDIKWDKKEAELGIIIGDRNYWDTGYGVDVVTTLLTHIFSQTNLQRIYLKTLDRNTRAQKCFEKCGFTPYGSVVRDGYSFILMELSRRQWQESQAKIARVFKE